MAKQELFKNKLFAKIISSLGAFPVVRGSKKSELAIHKAKDLLLESKIVGIFIEGTRSKDGALLRPKLGTARIAKLSDAPILPVSISTKFGKKISLFRKVTVSCGDLIYPHELKVSDPQGQGDFRTATNMIMSKIEKLRKKEI